MSKILKGAQVLLASAIFAGSAMAQTVTLKVWDTFTDHGANEGMEQLVEAFQKKHPNIKIQRDVQSANDMRSG